MGDAVVSGIYQVLRGVKPMDKKEQEALKNIKELLNEFSDGRYIPHVTREDLEMLVKLIEKSAKK